MGLSQADMAKKMTADDLANTTNSIFAATGVSTGPLLRGVDFTKWGAKTFSLVMREKSKTVRFIETHHKFKHDPDYALKSDIKNE